VSFLLTLIVFLPSAGALGVMLIPAEQRRAIRWFAAITTLVVFALTLILFFGAHNNFGDINHLNFVQRVPWINITIGSLAFKIEYFLGVDGLATTMVILNGLLSFLAVVGSWHIDQRTKEYMALLLILETGVMGVFVAADLFLFFLFWEVELVPMFLLIGIWGGANREYAAWKFILYTLTGSAIMLAGILLLYFNLGAQTGVYTADMTYLSNHFLHGSVSIGSLTISLQLIAFLLIFFGLAVKIPMFPFHTWLPDAHTEAPTAVSVILAGVLLKMGAYGLLRVNVGFFPQAAHLFAPYLGVLAVINVLYGAGCSMIQSDMKKMIAYSSVSHMGYVLLGVAGATAVVGASAIGYRQAAMTGAALQMFTHGTITGMLFFCVGVIYEKAHTRQIDEFGGIAARMPMAAFAFTFAVFASLGLPALSGFAAEYLVFTGTFAVLPIDTGFAVFGIVLTAGYLLWLIKRVFNGPLNIRWNGLADISTVGEILPLAALIVVILFVGIWPGLIVDVLRPSVTQLIHVVNVVALH